MSPEQAAIGRTVVYRSHPKASAEEGKIVSLQSLDVGIVHVVYRGDDSMTPKATYLTDLDTVDASTGAPVCVHCGSTGVLVERRGKMVCEWCARRYWPMTAEERRETAAPSPAHLRATEALAALTERANMAGVRLTYTAIVNAVLPPSLDVDEMAHAYGEAHFGPDSWDDAPAAIRNDVRNDMQRVRRAILGES